MYQIAKHLGLIDLIKDNSVIDWGCKINPKEEGLFSVYIIMEVALLKPSMFKILLIKDIDQVKDFVYSLLD
jgi:hypothetical protein